MGGKLALAKMTTMVEAEGGQAVKKETKVQVEEISLIYGPSSIKLLLDADIFFFLLLPLLMVSLAVSISIPAAAAVLSAPLPWIRLPACCCPTHSLTHCRSQLRIGLG
jgi:hypothetical protein